MIGENTKIDNLVQVAHNVRLKGRGCPAGGDDRHFGQLHHRRRRDVGGGAGLADHITVGDGARVAADAGVMHDIPAGERWVGSPARPARKFMREVAWLSKMASTRGGGTTK